MLNAYCKFSIFFVKLSYARNFKVLQRRNLVKILLIAFALTTSELFANGSTGGFDMMQLAPIVLIFVIFYFLIMRPQQKKARAHQDMLKELRKGDRVVTAGGILGTVDKVVNDGEISLEIADSVKVRVLKATVSSVVAKTQPIADSTKQNTSKDDSEPRLSIASDSGKKVQSKNSSAKKNTSKSKVSE
jgi:preprotein translocase subunit YajC